MTKNNKTQEKIDSHISSILKQMNNFLKTTSLELMPVEWLQPENKTKKDEFSYHLCNLFDQSYFKRNEELSNINKNLDFLSWRRIIPSFIICFLAIIGLFLHLLHVFPDYYAGGLIQLYFLSLFSAAYFYNKYNQLFLQSKKILKHWCLSGAEEEIRQKMRKMVGDMERNSAVEKEMEKGTSHQ